MEASELETYRKNLVTYWVLWWNGGRDEKKIQGVMASFPTGMKGAPGVAAGDNPTVSAIVHSKQETAG